jgi:hypothetical protein
MPFEFKKVLEHGSTNPIVARLSLQILEILKQCDASKDIQDKVRDLYVDSLLKKLLRCWEIEERFNKEFAAAVGKYRPPATANAPVEVPQIARLDEECHNFLYEAKNFIRDLLQVVNQLYGTTFKEASEFFRARKKGSRSLVEFAEKTFGVDDAKTKMIRGAVPSVKEWSACAMPSSIRMALAESLSSRTSRSARTDRLMSRHGIARRMVRPLASPH